MNNETKNDIYAIIRFIQFFSIGVFIFGALWEGTLRFNFTTPQFLMVYGLIGAVVSEVIARLFKKKMLIK